MPHKPGVVESLLQTKFGFTPADSKSKDHCWYERTFQGLPTIRTKMSRHKEDLGKGLEGKIARQLRVRKEFYNGMIDCTNSSAAYEKQVRESPYPPFDQIIIS
jgi:hypothetical protein